MTLADEILATEDRPATEVEAWGKKLFIKPMSGTDKNSYDLLRHKAGTTGEQWLPNYRAHFLVRCLFDGQGNRIFADAQAEQFAEKNGEMLNRLFDQAWDINKAGAGHVAGEVKKLLARDELFDWHRLAFDELHCTVEEAQQRVDSAQFARWRAWRKIDPSLSDRLRFHAAFIIAAAIAPGTGQFDPGKYLHDFASAYREPEDLSDLEEEALARKIHQSFMAGVVLSPPLDPNISEDNSNG